MKYLALVFLLGLLGSCGLYSNLDTTAKNLAEISETAKVRVDQADKMLDKAETALASVGVEAKAMVAEAKSVVAAADKNGDGQISGFNEWIAGLGGILLLLWRQLNGESERRRETNKALFEKVDEMKKLSIEQLLSSRSPPA